MRAVVFPPGPRGIPPPTQPPGGKHPAFPQTHRDRMLASFAALCGTMDVLFDESPSGFPGVRCDPARVLRIPSFSSAIAPRLSFTFYNFFEPPCCSWRRDSSHLPP